MDLEKRAHEIPTMTNLETKLLLRKYASQIKSNQNIVEVGVWLGSCTAFIALGLKNKYKTNTIHVYDRFCANELEVNKAEWGGVVLYEGEKTTQIFKSYLEPFHVNIKIHKGNIGKIKYNGDKIGLFIDDASEQQECFEHTINTFINFFIPGETIIFLMDYYFFKKKGINKYRYQYDWMQKHKNEFEYIQRVNDTCVAIFKYIGKVKK